MIRPKVLMYCTPTTFEIFKENLKISFILTKLENSHTIKWTKVPSAKLMRSHDRQREFNLCYIQTCVIMSCVIKRLRIHKIKMHYALGRPRPPDL